MWGVSKMTIKELRMERHMTQEALAEAAGCARITIARLEAGKMPTTMKIVNGLSTALGVSADEIFRILNGDEAQ